jgi:hypothetical protein
MGAVLTAGAARAARSLAAAAALAGAASGCGDTHATVPPVPMEAQSVAAEYDMPTGTVPIDAATEIGVLQQTLATIADTDIVDVGDEVLLSLRDRLHDADLTVDPAAQPRAHRPLVRGAITIDRTCRGWDDTSTTPEPSVNGALQIVGEIDGSMLTRTVFGTASMCHERITVADGTTVHTYLDGTLVFFLNGPLPTSASNAQFVMVWMGTIGTEATGQVTVSFDFRITNGQIEVRIPVADGSIIGSIGVNGVSMRGANGNFACSVQTLTCGQIQTARGGTASP